MPEAHYEVTHAGSRDEVVIISVHGYIDSTTSPGLSRIIDQQIAQEKYRLIINLQDVDYISSMGWGVFISNLKKIRDHRGDLVLTSMCTNVHNVFELMELSSIIKYYEYVHLAIEYFLDAHQQEALKEQRSAASAVGYKITAPEHRNQTRAPKSPSPSPIRLVSRSEPGLPDEPPEDTPGHQLEKCIVKVVLDSPYYSIRQIKKALRLPRYGSVKKSKRKIKKELVKLGLENKKERYEFALQNRKKS
ncbi:MAG: STAS domain-containing protein [Spirochaetota bacterium]